MKDRDGRQGHVELLDDAMVEIYRSWTPARRLQAVNDQFKFARDLMRGAIASENPDWSPEQVSKEVVRRMLGRLL